MLNKYLEELKNGTFRIEMLEDDVYFVHYQNNNKDKELDTLLQKIISAINSLNNTIKTQDKPLAQTTLEELISSLNLLDDTFFSILKNKNEINNTLINKHSLSDKDTKIAFVNNKKEIDSLIEILKNSKIDYGLKLQNEET